MPLNFPVQASVPPLSGVFQQCIARRTKRLAPRPMHAPAIPVHHEGNGFDLLFLVQAPNSFLFYMQLVTSNRSSEEKAGHLYAVCLKFAAWRRYTLRLRRNVWQHRLQPYAHLFFGYGYQPRPCRVCLGNTGGHGCHFRFPVPYSSFGSLSASHFG